MRVRRASVLDAPLVQEIFEGSPEYFRRVEQSEVKPDSAIHEMNDVVPLERQGPKYEKIFCLIESGGIHLGVVDLHRNHPVEDCCYIGLFLLRETEQGRGIGRVAYRLVEEFIRSELSCTKIKIGISFTNDVEGFWLKMGYVRSGHKYKWTARGVSNQVFEMEKVI
jgi:RimJ/RimL family protein N-acetyltransferase